MRPGCAESISILAIASWRARDRRDRTEGDRCSCLKAAARGKSTGGAEGSDLGASAFRAPSSPSTSAAGAGCLLEGIATAIATGTELGTVRPLHLGIPNTAAATTTIAEATAAK